MSSYKVGMLYRIISDDVTPFSHHRFKKGDILRCIDSSDGYSTEFFSAVHNVKQYTGNHSLGKMLEPASGLFAHKLGRFYV